jgi:class 3 adenylate cyclase
VSREPESGLEGLLRENEALKRRLAKLQRNTERQEKFQQQNSSLLRAAMDDLDVEKAKSERLLLNILPAQIVERLNGGEEEIADRFDDVTVLFTDFVGFTHASAKSSPRQVVRALNDVFSEFDAQTQALGVEKIKTIGDAYLAVAGLPEPRRDHCEAAADLALEMLRIVEDSAEERDQLSIRIGLHSGAVMAGIVGIHKFVYDVWGDTVNFASRLESSAEPGTIHISESVARILKFDFDVKPRGEVALKGKGDVTTFFLTGRKPV